MDKKKNINLPCLCAILLIILVGAVAYLYFRVFYLLPQEVVFSITTNEKLSYQLFDNQFSHMLTTITILIAMFGLALPLATYFFQQRNFREDKEEINKIKDKIEREFDKFKEIRSDFPKIQEDMPKIKHDFEAIQQEISQIKEQIKEFDEIKNALPEIKKDLDDLQNDFQKTKKQLHNYKELVFTSQEFFSSKVNDAYKEYTERLKDLKQHLLKNNSNNLRTVFHQKVVEAICEFYRCLSNLYYLSIISEDKGGFVYYFDKHKYFVETIHQYQYYQQLLPFIVDIHRNINNIMCRKRLKDFLGEDSQEYKEYLNLFSDFFKEFDKGKNEQHSPDK